MTNSILKKHPMRNLLLLLSLLSSVIGLNDILNKESTTDNKLAPIGQKISESENNDSFVYSDIDDNTSSNTIDKKGAYHDLFTPHGQKSDGELLNATIANIIQDDLSIKKTSVSYYKMIRRRSSSKGKGKKSIKKCKEKSYKKSKSSYKVSKSSRKGKGSLRSAPPSMIDYSKNGKGKGKGSTKYDCEPTVAPSHYPLVFSIVPSFAPSTFFNFTNCESYYSAWADDLKNSCVLNDDGELINCRCDDAQRRIDNGQIDCGVDQCPDDCDVCKFCLYYVVDCHSHAPSTEPSSMLSSNIPTSISSGAPSSHPSATKPNDAPVSTPSQSPSSSSYNPTSVVSVEPSSSPYPTLQQSISPSVSSSSSPSIEESTAPSVELSSSPYPTLQQSISPSVLSSSSPSVEESSEPSLSPFDINDCDSYSNTWLLDLEHSCVTNDNDELINCQCNDAQIRIDNDQIDCGVDLCPDDCDVCKFCLYYVVDCHSHAPSTEPSSIPSELISSVPSLSPTQTSSPSILIDSPSVTPSASSSHPSATKPNDAPVSTPSQSPSSSSYNPTSVVSVEPSSSPYPTLQQSISPSVLSSSSPSVEGSAAPSVELSSSPYPTLQQSISPSVLSSSSPSVEESSVPSSSPTQTSSPSILIDSPSITPSVASKNLTSQPSFLPSSSPTLNHSLVPTSPPSPVSLFDISDCESYSNMWFLDLASSCQQTENGDLFDCQCYEAQRLLDEGKINCEVDRCPADCEVCSFCLIDVLQTDCRTSHPTVAPTISPTYSSFDINDCESYSNIWFFDIAISCGGDPDGDCKCIDAENRISNGQLVCGQDQCPSDCPACQFCLDQLSC